MRTGGMAATTVAIDPASAIRRGATVLLRQQTFCRWRPHSSPAYIRWTAMQHSDASVWIPLHSNLRVRVLRCWSVQIAGYCDIADAEVTAEEVIDHSVVLRLVS